MKKLLALFLAAMLLFTLGLGALADEKKDAGVPAADAGVAGTYTYSEVNSYTLEILWTLELNADGTYALSEENLVVGEATYTGTYTADGAVVTCGPMAEVGPEVYDWADPAGFVVTVSGEGFVPGAQAAGVAPGTYTDGVNTLVIAEDYTFVMETSGEDMDGGAFSLTVKGVYADGAFTITGLFDGDMDLTDIASEEQIAGDLATVEALAGAGAAASDAPLSANGWPLTGSGDVSMDAYKAYLKAYMDCVPEMDGHQEELFGLIDEEVFDEAPVAMAFEDWFQENAMSFEEFVAANGEYSLEAMALTNPAEGDPT